MDCFHFLIFFLNIYNLTVFLLQKKNISRTKGEENITNLICIINSNILFITILKLSNYFRLFTASNPVIPWNNSLIINWKFLLPFHFTTSSQLLRSIGKNVKVCIKSCSWMYTAFVFSFESIWQESSFLSVTNTLPQHLLLWPLIRSPQTI